MSIGSVVNGGGQELQTVEVAGVKEQLTPNNGRRNRVPIDNIPKGFKPILVVLKISGDAWHRVISEAFITGDEASGYKIEYYINNRQNSNEGSASAPTFTVLCVRK